MNSLSQPNTSMMLGTMPIPIYYYTIFSDRAEPPNKNGWYCDEKNHNVQNTKLTKFLSL